MAGINPFGWSRSLNYTRETYGKEVSGGLAITTFFGYFVMRMALGVNTGLMFELLGSFILSQTDFNDFAYDFRTHKNAKAIVTIGTLGGVAMGFALIVVDGITYTNKYLSDIDPPDAGRKALNRARYQAVARTLLWVGLAAMSGVVGTLLWHLMQNSKPQPQAGYRSSTGAIVQAGGAAILVAAPSILQLLISIG